MCDRGFPDKTRQMLVRNNLVIPFRIQRSHSEFSGPIQNSADPLLHGQSVQGFFLVMQFYYVDVFTVRNEIAKVMFLQASVCPRGWGVGVSASVHAWIPPPSGRPSREQTHLPVSRHPPGSRHPLEHTPPEQTPQRSRHPPGADISPRRDGHCCGRYASYWNAFLLLFSLCDWGIRNKLPSNLHELESAWHLAIMAHCGSSTPQFEDEFLPRGRVFGHIK